MYEQGNLNLKYSCPSANIETEEGTVTDMPFVPKSLSIDGRNIDIRDVRECVCYEGGKKMKVRFRDGKVVIVIPIEIYPNVDDYEDMPTESAKTEDNDYST